jgi:4'-phosphopantetheinyl transferase EntD
MDTSVRKCPFGGLFDALPVIVEELSFDQDTAPCHPLEAMQTVHSAAWRRAEHAAGRQCARLAFAQLGIKDFVLLNGDDRCPIWPASVVGSITHFGRSAHGYSAAAVARADEVVALGIDAEDAQPLNRKLWDIIATRRELRFLAALTEHAGVHAKVLFCAKESFYKAQFIATRRMLDFQDVEIAVDWDNRQFSVIDVCGMGLPSAFISSRGLFALTSRHVLAAYIALA